jgi:predicted dehydrogenase
MLTLRLLQRPMAASVKEAEELTKVAMDNGVRTMVGLQGR